MKRLIVPTALAFVLTGSIAFAQQQAPAPIVQAPPTQGAPAQAAPDMQDGPKHHARNPHKEAMELSRKLNLTPDQTAKIEPIFADRQQKTAALMADTSLSDQDRKQQMHVIQKATKQQLDAVLTPEQREQMKAMHQGHHGEGEEAQPLTPPPSAM